MKPKSSESSPFPRTRWSLVGRAADPSSEEAHAALGELLVQYMPALRAYLIIGQRLPQDQADDILQKFMEEKVILGDLLSYADRRRGKFRTFLLTSLKRYLISDVRKRQAASRRPDAPGWLPLHEVEDVLQGARDTEAVRIYELAWARQVMRETLDRVRKQCLESNRAHFWELFENRVLYPIFNNKALEPYAGLVARLGFESPIQAASALSTVKRMFRRTLRNVVWEYAEDETEVDSEIDALYAIFAALPPPSQHPQVEL